jgi:hypothetical protein
VGQKGGNSNSCKDILFKRIFQSDVQISVPNTLRESTSGLCGYWDDNAENDWVDEENNKIAFQDFATFWVDDSIRGMLGLFFS